MTITGRLPTPCPDAETLAAFADGRLARHDVARLTEHLDTCELCMDALEAANEVLNAEGAEVLNAEGGERGEWWAGRSWMLAAAAVVVAALSLAIVGERLGLLFRADSPMERLIELSPRAARVAEPRLTGGFGWAAYRGPMRADESGADAGRLKLAGAAGDLIERADGDRSADAQHSAGIALVLIDKPLEAVARLRATVESSPRDAGAWTDLAAAQYSAALQLGRPSLFPEALASVDQALRIDPRLAEALFNRALILERLGLASQARPAWQAYLQVDPSSAWADEARQRLARIPVKPAESLFKRDLPGIENAAEKGDTRTLDELLDRHAQHARAWGEAEHLGRWADAVQRGDDAEAAQMLAIARGIGEALVRTSGESLLREAVRTIDEGPASRVAVLADAHATYRRGRIAYSKQRLAEAEVDLTRAAKLFEQARSPMSLVARYYAANVLFDRNDVRGANAALQALLQESDAQPRYMALGAQVRWELALCWMMDGDFNGALPLLLESQRAFDQLGERNHLGFIQSLLADAWVSLGRPDEAWAARIRAFELLSVDGHGERLPVSLKAAAGAELRRGRLETARVLLDLQRATADTAGDSVTVADALVRVALVNEALSDSEGASRSVREAAAAAERIADPSLRDLTRLHVQLAAGATALRSDPARARAELTRAIDGYGGSGRTLFLPECHLLRGRASLRLGERDRAAADFETGIALLERTPVPFGSLVGTGVFNAGTALFEEAISLTLDGHDLATAFHYVERSRIQLGREKEPHVVGTEELRKRLGTSGVAVLEVVALPAEIVVFCVTADDVAVERRSMSRRDAELLADRVSGGEGTAPLAELYDLVVRPFEESIGRSRHLIVVTDSLFAVVPFAALYDSAGGRYLITRVSVSMAVSASSLRPHERADDHPSLVAVGLPSGETMATVALPESMSEVAEIASSYRNAITMAPDGATLDSFVEAASAADVIHIAGHTERQPGETGLALRFARERVSWNTVAAERFRGAPIVVLAACETLRQERLHEARRLSLGGGFLAAGARDVIGTLAPIADRDARELFRSVHQHLATGSSAADALRAVQLEAIARTPDRAQGAWRSLAVLTQSIDHRT